MEGERDDLNLRVLSKEDIESLVRLDQEISGRARRTWYEHKVDRALNNTDVMISLGVEMDGQIVGAILGSVHYGEFGLPEPIAVLDTLLVDRRFRGRGIGVALLDQVTKNLRALRISKLRTEVSWNELELIDFFDRAGFAPVPRMVLELDLESD